MVSYRIWYIRRNHLMSAIRRMSHLIFFNTCTGGRRPTIRAIPPVKRTMRRRLKLTWLRCVHESCHTCQWVVSHMSMSRVTHVCMSHVAHVNEWCHTCQRVMSQWKHWSCHMRVPWVMSHIWMSGVTHKNGVCLVYCGVMSYTWMQHVTHRKGSCHTYEWGMWHTGRSHVTHMNEVCDT